MRNGGTDFATHVVRSLLGFAKQHGLSAIALFLDLEKAYDRVIREVFCDLPHDFSGTRYDYFVDKLGLPPDVAAFLLAEDIAANGCVLEEAGVHPKIIRAINAMRSRSWFR